jgi:hypothetical protein
MESPWKKFLDTVMLNDLKNVADLYRNMRVSLQKEGIRQSQLEKGVNIPHNIYMEREFTIYALKQMKAKLRKYGLIEGGGFEFDDYISEIFSKIDEETPLENGR